MKRHAGKADLADGDHRPAGVARRHAGDVAHHAAVHQDLDIGAGVEDHRVGAGEADQSGESPGANMAARSQW